MGVTRVSNSKMRESDVDWTGNFTRIANIKKATKSQLRTLLSLRPWEVVILGVAGAPSPHTYWCGRAGQKEYGGRISLTKMATGDIPVHHRPYDRPLNQLAIITHPSLLVFVIMACG